MNFSTATCYGSNRIRSPVIKVTNRELIPELYIALGLADRMKPRSSKSRGGGLPQAQHLFVCLLWFYVLAASKVIGTDM